MGCDYYAKVIVGINTSTLTIDNSEKYKKVVNHPGRRTKNSNSEKIYSYTKREYKVRGFDEEIFDYESDAWDFMERKSGLEYVSHEDSPSTVIGKIILSGSGEDNSAYQSMDFEEIAKVKEAVEKTIFETFGVEVHAKVHFVGYYV